MTALAPQDGNTAAARDMLAKALEHLPAASHQHARDLIGQAMDALSAHRDEGVMPQDLNSSNDG